VQVDVNPALCAMTGFSMEELIGSVPPHPYWPPEEYARIQAAFSETLQGHFADFELTFMRKNGERFPVIVSPSAVKNKDGATISFIATVKDITALQLLQKQALHAQKMQAIGQLTGGIAHDFNNMLASIAGYTDLALECLAPEQDSTLASYLNEVKTASQRARNLIVNMLAFSRGGGGKGEVQNVAVASLITEVLKLLRAVMPSSIEIVSTTTPGTHRLRIDPVHLHQMIMNLCINARDAIGAHGVIEIGLTHSGAVNAVCTSCLRTIDGEFEEIFVRDNGSGITPEILAHVFEPFYSTKEVGKGTGMGLSTVHGLVHGYGGHIVVTSTPGSGTTLRLLLPAAVADAPLSAAAQMRGEVPVAKSAGALIMVVDDELPLAQLTGMFLERRGYKTEICSDSQAALKLFGIHPARYAALITDFTMPDLNGFELARAVLALRADLPVILVSGNADQMDSATIEFTGVRRFFAKPIDYATLLQAVEELLQVKG
jgi:PAS domain S-box-containing protein